MELRSLLNAPLHGEVVRLWSTMWLATLRVVYCLFVCEAIAAEPHVLLEVGRDYPETRLFSACVLNGRTSPRLAVAGFSQTAHGDVADLAVYEITDMAAIMQARIMQRGHGRSSIRTLRAADLDGDGQDELIALGRAGDEEVDSTGELQIYSFKDDLLQVQSTTSWQSGRYTHGYGMDLADLDGDGQIEIITGGFFRDDIAELAELRIWQLDGTELKLLASQSWGADTGDTRVNAVCAGDVTDDGRMDIIAAGRAGQVRGPDDTNQSEADQITVWTYQDEQLNRVASYEGDAKRRSRFREVRLANIDGRAGLEILAAGRTEVSGRGRGTVGGGGNGTGGGGGKGTGGGGRTAGAIRPVLQAFRVEGERLIVTTEAEWGDVLGEVRDVATIGRGDKLQIVTVLADDLKPERQARITIWEMVGKTFQSIESQTSSSGDETRARQIVAWRSREGSRLLTVGFVKRGDQILGQVIAWPTDVSLDSAGPN